MPQAPSFERAEQALEDALASLPLPASYLADPQLRTEYVSLVLFVLHTKERLALLAGMWEGKGLPLADANAVPPDPTDDLTPLTRPGQLRE